MKKNQIKFFIFIGLLIFLWVIGRLTGAILFYRTPTQSMEPTLKLGSIFFVSNLKKPKRNNIIVFKRTTTEKDGFVEPGKRLTFVHRLIAFGGETLQVKNGLAYVNGKLVDDSTRLKFNYQINIEDAQKVAEVLKMDLSNPLNSPFAYSSDSRHYIIPLSYKEFVNIKVITQPVRDTTDHFSNILYANDDSKKWTANNYGPIKIPADCYFVLGDNRNQSSDSRFNGPAPKKDWVGTVIWKK